MRWLLGDAAMLTGRSLSLRLRRPPGGSVPVPPPEPDPWTNIIPLDGGPQGVTGAFFRGLVTQNGDGSRRVTTAAGSTNGRALVNMPEMAAGTRILLQWSLQFDNAARLILRQVESNDSTGGVTIFDVLRANVGPVYTGSIEFGVITNRRFLHFIGVSQAGQFFTINPQTRWRLAP